jgi:hypothetical protein
MKHTPRLPLAVAVTAFLLAGGCGETTIENPLPVIISSSGPTSPVTPFQPDVTTQASIDVKGWTGAEIFLRTAAFPTADNVSAETAAQKLASTEANEITDLNCQPDAQNQSLKNCSFTFPGLGTVPQSGFQKSTLRPSSTVFYQWLVEYSLPEGEDKAYVKAAIASLSVAGSCASDSDCSDGLTCRRDPHAPPAVDHCLQVFGIELPFFCEDDGGLAPLICLPPASN